MHLLKYGKTTQWHHFKVTTFWVVEKGMRTKFTPRPGATKTVYGLGVVPSTEQEQPSFISGVLSSIGSRFAGREGDDTQWTPYESPTGNAASAATFHVLVDARAVRPGESVMLDGNLDALSAWGGGVPMQPHPRNPLLWSARVLLPFTATDACARGMFQFSYSISTNERGKIKEGGECFLSESFQMDSSFAFFMFLIFLPRRRSGGEKRGATLLPRVSAQRQGPAVPGLDHPLWKGHGANPGALAA